MPTKDPSKNVEYVKNSQSKKKKGIRRKRMINADTEQRHRGKLKTSLGEKEYKNNKRNIWRNIEQKRKQKRNVEKKAINTLTGAIRTRAARRQMEAAAIENANRTADKVTDTGKTLKPFYIAAIRQDRN
jgi:hydroxypyruvate isomerase